MLFRRHVARRRWQIALAAGAMAVVSAWLSFSFTPPASVRVGTVDAQLRARPGTGTLVRPAEGRAIADAALNNGPLQLQVAVAVPRASAGTEPQLLSSISRSRPLLIRAVVEYLLRVLAAAIVIAVLLMALVLGFGWRLLVSAVAAAAVVLSSVAVSVATTRFSAFASQSCSHGWSRYVVADLPELTPPAPVVDAPADAVAAANPGLVGLLLISDDHLNPEGLRFAQRVQHATGATAVLDAGDTTSFGVPGEACVVAPLIRQFHVPYLWARGNHDSPSFARDMRAIPGVHVLDRTATSVAGINVFGVADPSFTPRRTTSEATMAAADAATRVQTTVDLAMVKQPPDIVLVHECPMVIGDDGIQGDVPLVACGHLHRFLESTDDGSTVLHTGTVGAGGLGAFRAGQLRTFGAVLLYLSADTHRLASYWVIDGAGGQPAQWVWHDAASLSTGAPHGPATVAARATRISR